jgi:hypothetical protein
MRPSRNEYAKCEVRMSAQIYGIRTQTSSNIFHASRTCVSFFSPAARRMLFMADFKRIVWHAHTNKRQPGNTRLVSVSRGTCNQPARILLQLFHMESHSLKNKQPSVHFLALLTFGLSRVSCVLSSMNPPLSRNERNPGQSDACVLFRKKRQTIEDDSSRWICRVKRSLVSVAMMHMASRIRIDQLTLEWMRQTLRCFLSVHLSRVF